MTPEPTGKLDARTQVVVNGPADDPAPSTGESYGLTPTDLHGLLERDAGKLASPVPRGARPSNEPGLPDESAAGPWAILTSLTR